MFKEFERGSNVFKEKICDNLHIDHIDESLPIIERVERVMIGKYCQETGWWPYIMIILLKNAQSSQALNDGE